MELTISASLGKKNAALVDLNQRNREFYSRQAKVVQSAISEPHIANLACELLSNATLRASNAGGPAGSICRLWATPLFEEKVLEIVETRKLLNLKHTGQKLRRSADQAKRASYRRCRIGDSRRTLFEIIEEISLCPEHRGLRARNLWPHLDCELRTDGCNPEETPSKSGDHRKDRIEYDILIWQTDPETGKSDWVEKRKSLSFGRFENIVSKIRKASQKAG